MMKTYKERLPEIDKAIFELGGDWPPCVGDTSDFSRPFLISSTDNHSRGAGIYSCSNFGAEHDNVTWVRICTRTEFEARVSDWRRLYEWHLSKGMVWGDDDTFEDWVIVDKFRKWADEYATELNYNWQLSLDDNRHGSVKPDIVNHPSHYAFFDGTEAIEVIAGSMSEEQFRGYCIGNKLKYCLRAGKKGDALEDLAKANKYEDLFNKFKHLCRA